MLVNLFLRKYHLFLLNAQDNEREFDLMDSRIVKLRNDLCTNAALCDADVDFLRDKTSHK